MKNIWSEVRNDFTDDNIAFIDAWLTTNENEAGKVIAKVNLDDGQIEYIDERAKTDHKVQEVINEIVNDF